MAASTAYEQATGTSPRKKKSYRLSQRKATQIRVGITLGHAYLTPRGKGRLHTITEKEYLYLRGLTQGARDDGSLTHKAYYHIVKKQTTLNVRRLVRTDKSGIVETLFT